MESGAAASIKDAIEREARVESEAELLRRELEAAGTALGKQPADEVKESTGERKVFVDAREPAPRYFYLTKREAEKHGYTRGCAGCNSWFRGLGRAPHTVECRERFRRLLKDDAKVKNAEARRREPPFFEKKG